MSLDMQAVLSRLEHLRGGVPPASAVPGPEVAPIIPDATEARADHLARTLRQTMEAGAVPIWPVPWNRVLYCARCGPVYWGVGGEVDGCPWCWVRLDGFNVPGAS